jgi:hypothetical protein
MSYNPLEAAQNRGLKVLIKNRNTLNAEVTDEIQLYSKSYALVIGIDDYTNGWPRLSHAVLDAQKVANELKQRGFEVSFKKNLTSRELKNTLEEFFIFKGNDPQARLFVWLPGHLPSRRSVSHCGGS